VQLERVRVGKRVERVILTWVGKENAELKETSTFPPEPGRARVMRLGANGPIPAINAHPLEKVKSAIAKAHRAKTRRLRGVFAL
jgi:hypothetical protein